MYDILQCNYSIIILLKYQKQQNMNIYTILMSKDKCETFFPKLGGKSKKQSLLYVSKRLENSTQKLRNKSIDNKGKFRMTYHDILQLPSSNNIQKQMKKEQKLQEMRMTFVKKTVQNINKIGQYQVVKQIGKGGFAEVVQVKDENGNKFAMKKYTLQNSLQCFRNQYIVGEHFFESGKLRRGVNLIKYIERIKNGRKGFIIQQIGGKSLSKMISQIHGVFYKSERVYQVQFTKFYQQLALKKKLKNVLLQIAYGVKLLNSEGFTHCDLKPENILINQQQNGNITCKIIDYGSAFIYQNGLPKITITPQYMPPELLQAIQQDNTQAKLSKIDVWSLGSIMLQIMTGVPLWYRYKCKLVINGRQSLQLGFFALTNRQYRKIIKKQRQICQIVKKLTFVYPEFQPYRKILNKILVFDQNQRASIDQVISMLEKLQ